MEKGQSISKTVYYILLFLSRNATTTVAAILAHVTEGTDSEDISRKEITKAVKQAKREELIMESNQLFSLTVKGENLIFEEPSYFKYQRRRLNYKLKHIVSPGWLGVFLACLALIQPYYSNKKNSQSDEQVNSKIEKQDSVIYNIKNKLDSIINQKINTVDSRDKQSPLKQDTVHDRRI